MKSVAIGNSVSVQNRLDNVGRLDTLVITWMGSSGTGAFFLPPLTEPPSLRRTNDKRAPWSLAISGNFFTLKPVKEDEGDLVITSGFGWGWTYTLPETTTGSSGILSPVIVSMPTIHVQVNQPRVVKKKKEDDEWVLCNRCGGTTRVTCSHCRGTGEVPCRTCNGKRGRNYNCSCGGTGREKCLDCDYGITDCPFCDGGYVNLSRDRY